MVEYIALFWGGMGDCSPVCSLEQGTGFWVRKVDRQISLLVCNLIPRLLFGGGVWGGGGTQELEN